MVSNLTTKSPRKYPISCQAFAFPVNLSRVQWNYVKINIAWSVFNPRLEIYLNRIETEQITEALNSRSFPTVATRRKRLDNTLQATDAVNCLGVSNTRQSFLLESITISA